MRLRAKLLLVVAGVMLLSSCSRMLSYLPSAERRRFDEVKLNARIRYTGNEVVIVNRDSFPWRNIQFSFGSDKVADSYIHRKDVIGARSSYRARWHHFTTKEGKRLAAVKRQRMHLTIICDTPQGQGVWSAEGAESAEGASE